MKDVQLAMVVLRLYDSELKPSDLLTYKKLLEEKVLGVRNGDEEEEEDGVLKATRSYDPFLRSMASWVLNDYSGSLETLLEEDDGEEVEDVSSFARQSSFKSKSHTPMVNRGMGYRGSNLGGTEATNINSSLPTEDSSKLTARSSVFNFYIFLRTHPLIIRHQQQKNSHLKNYHHTDFINAVERRLGLMFW